MKTITLTAQEITRISQALQHFLVCGTWERITKEDMEVREISQKFRGLESEIRLNCLKDLGLAD